MTEIKCPFGLMYFLMKTRPPLVVMKRALVMDLVSAQTWRSSKSSIGLIVTPECAILPDIFSRTMRKTTRTSRRVIWHLFDRWRGTGFLRAQSICPGTRRTATKKSILSGSPTKPINMNKIRHTGVCLGKLIPGGYVLVIQITRSGWSACRLWSLHNQELNIARRT